MITSWRPTASSTWKNRHPYQLCSGQSVHIHERRPPGIYFQKNYPQAKLVRVIKGIVFDVTVDLRKDRKTFGKWYGIELTDENKKQFLVPRGFGQGFVVLNEVAEFCYKCDDFYHANNEGGLAWNNPELGILWPKVMGQYRGSAAVEGYTLEDGTVLNLSKKGQKQLGMKDTFMF